MKEQWNEGGKIRGCGGENDKEGKNETGETGEIKGAETDSERGGSLVSEQRQAGKREGRGKRGATDVMANHFSLKQSQELFANAAAPRQRLVWG